MNFDLDNSNQREVVFSQDITDTARVIEDTYGAMAGDEILLRALVSNRDLDIERTNFWLDVYRRLHTAEAA